MVAVGVDMQDLLRHSSCSEARILAKNKRGDVEEFSNDTFLLTGEDNDIRQ